MVHCSERGLSMLRELAQIAMIKIQKGADHDVTLCRNVNMYANI